MNRRIVKVIFILGAFAVPCILYLQLWQLISQNVLNSIGYSLWLSASTDDLLNTFRIFLIHYFFQGAMPVLVGLVGMWWMLIWIRHRQN